MAITFSYYRIYRRYANCLRTLFVLGLFSLVMIYLRLSLEIRGASLSIDPDVAIERGQGRSVDLKDYWDDALFLPKYVDEHKGPVGSHHVRAALGTMPQRHKLMEVQEDILENQHRPPDSVYNVNVTKSDMMSLDRSIEDTRPEQCKNIEYNLESLPKASIVIPFYNEALSLLLRTIHSILNRTPPELLIEVLLVDDSSSHEHLKEPLERYISLLPKVKLMRTMKREGLISARLLGADAASGEVVVFLDAHTECNVGWLEPMLAEIQAKPNTVVQPFIDGIDKENLLYSKPNIIHTGSFTWDLRFVWMKVPDHVNESASKYGRPFWSPTLVGCAMAVNKTYFNSIGAFDTGQKVWGGENIELAFRTWMCGGTVVTTPCSRVGHVFRPVPYKNDDLVWQAQWQKNLMRVAELWMGEYKKYFYTSTRIYEARRVNFTMDETTSLQQRLKIKEELKCKNFEWYLSNVVPDIPIPPHDAVNYGEVTSYRTNACWEVLEDGYLKITYACYENKIINDNIFTLNKDGLLLYKEHCVRFLFPSPFLKVEPCPEKPDLDWGLWELVFPNQARWARIQVTMRNNGDVNTWCIMQVTNAIEPHKDLQMPQVAPCDINNLFQYWAFTYRFDYQG